MTSPATMQMRTSAWRDAIGGASRRVGGRAGRGVSQSREERSVGGVQGSPDWFEWTQTAELPPAPPSYRRLRPRGPDLTLERDSRDRAGC